MRNCEKYSVQMLRILVISIVMVAIHGLLLANSLISNIAEFGLLSVAYLILLVGKKRAQLVGTLPVFHPQLDYAIALFFMLWVITSLINQKAGAENLVALVRYIPLAYLVGKFLNMRDIKVIALVLVAIGVSQMLIGSLQLMDVLPWTLAEVGKEKKGLYGIFKDNISYAALMMISMIVVIELFTEKRRLRQLFALMFLIFILFSGSRAYFLIGLLFFVMRVMRVPVRLVFVGGVIGVLVIVLIGVDLGNNNEDFLYFLSSTYFSMAMHQRLGLILELLPQFLTSQNMLMGLGSDKELAVAYVVTHYSFNYLNPEYLIYIFEDVYWSSMLMYYGLLGTLTFIAYLCGIYLLSIRLRCQLKIDSGILLLFNWLFMSALGLGLVGQVFEVKVFSLFFWIFAGAVLIERRNLHENFANK